MTPRQGTWPLDGCPKGMSRPAPIDLFPRSLAVVGLLFAAGMLYLSGEPGRALAARERAWGEPIREGDFVFQDIDCGIRCQMIRMVTESRYVHVGLVLGHGDDRVVWEAYEPVGPVPLTDWIARGVHRQVAVYRPDDALLLDLPRARLGLAEMAGRPYDADYQWDDERIYCSELLIKAFAHGGRAPFVTPHAVDLGSRAPAIARATGGRLTSATRMVTPRDLIESPRLRRVVDELASRSPQNAPR